MAHTHKLTLAACLCLCLPLACADEPADESTTNASADVNLPPADLLQSQVDKTDSYFSCDAGQLDCTLECEATATIVIDYVDAQCVVGALDMPAAGRMPSFAHAGGFVADRNP